MYTMVLVYRVRYECSKLSGPAEQYGKAQATSNPMDRELITYSFVTYTFVSYTFVTN